MSAEDAKKKRLPLWCRALVLLVILCFGLALWSGVSAVCAIKHIAKDAFDPVVIRRTAEQIAHFPEPLPEGYQFVSCLSLPLMNMVSIEHNPDKQQIALYSVDSSKKEDEKQILDWALDVGITLWTTTARFQDVKYKGNAKIASENMPYIVGDTIDSRGNKGQGMVGCVQPPSKEGVKKILIYALQTSNVPYNHQITMNLLNAIKGF